MKPAAIALLFIAASTADTAAASPVALGWRYNPGVENGVLVGGEIRVPIRFNAPCGR